MKLSVVVLLFVFMANSSLTAASDTLHIKSFRTIDVCSGEKRWLLSASIGEVYASDSLQSFDITIGYDSSRITPTDGLSIGTLADQMRFGDLSPFFNFREPQEIRVGAFTINSNVKGDMPLFAVAGTYKGSCNDEDTLSLPWNPQFNEEFKGEVKFFKSDTIRAIAVAVDDETQGATIHLDTLLLNGEDSTGTTGITVYHSKMQSRPLLVQLFTGDKLVSVIDTVVEIEEAEIEYSIDRDSVSIQFNTESRDSTTFLVTLRSTNSDTLAETVFDVSVKDETECTCVKPTLTDVAQVITKEPIVSVPIMEVHDRSVVRFLQMDEGIKMQFSHRQLWIVTIVDILGNTVFAASTDHNGYLESLTQYLPTGAYVLHATSGKESLVKKFLK